MMIDYPNIKNRQQAITIRAWFLAGVFLLFILLPFFDNNFVSGAWALVFISLFLMISAMVTAIIFGKRSRKMKKLLNREKLIAHWQIDRELLCMYVEENSRLQRNKNKALLWVTGFFFVLISVLFLFFLENDERIAFFLIMLSVFMFIFLAVRVLLWVYTYKNRNGDGQVLIGSKYLYVNGYFHNWDFPMSGLEKLKAIKSPFNGIQLGYYYTDRTGPNTFELKIPVPVNIDIEELILRIKSSK